VVQQGNHLLVPPFISQLQEGCQYSSQPVLQQGWNNASSSRFRHQASILSVARGLPIFFPTGPAAVVKQFNQLQVPPPGKLITSCKRVANIYPNLYFSNGGITQSSPGSATRQVNNQFQEGCQYSSQPAVVVKQGNHFLVPPPGK
jgi:hypothetical protein